MSGGKHLNIDCFESNEVEQEFKKKVQTVEETDAEQEMWALYRCKWLLETKHLDWEQLYWYYTMERQKGDYQARISMHCRGGFPCNRRHFL